MRTALIACLLLAATACSAPDANDEPVGPPPVPGPAAPPGQLEVTVFAPVEGLLCVPLPLRFVIRNGGSAAVAGVHVHCDLPEGLVTQDGQPAFDFDVGALPAGESAEALASAQATRTGRFRLHATVSGADGSRGGSYDATTFVGQPILALSITAPAQQVVGQDIACVLELTNTGDGTALEVVVEDQLPRGVSVVSASEAARITRDSVQFWPGKLAPKATQRFELTLRGTAVGTLRWSAWAQAACATVVGASAETVISAEGGNGPR
jgi:uncharacterized repeat protein (TIGR01451 family)